MTDYGTFADQIIEGVGGIQNISNVTHCFSRLRFTLKDQSLVDEAALKSLDGVAGTVIAAGRCQSSLATKWRASSKRSRRA